MIQVYINQTFPDYGTIMIIMVRATLINFKRNNMLQYLFEAL
jgi:hypothetical protein